MKITKEHLKVFPPLSCPIVVPSSWKSCPWVVNLKSKSSSLSKRDLNIKNVGSLLSPSPWGQNLLIEKTVGSLEKANMQNLYKTHDCISSIFK